METTVTIVLIPGLLCDASVWAAQIPALSAHGPVVVADLSTQDSITAMARETLALAEGPLAVAGHSMGARVALEMVRLAPERIERLALLDGTLEMDRTARGGLRLTARLPA